MSEFMGLVGGEYDAKTGGGFRPGGASLHNVMSAHGPDAETHGTASGVELKPVKVGEGSMAFMFESSLMVGVTDWGLRMSGKVQEGYNEESWTPLKSHFKAPNGARRDTHMLRGKSDGGEQDTVVKSPGENGASGKSLDERMEQANKELGQREVAM